MTSVHHHPTSDVGLHHVPDWVWIGLAVLLAIGFGLGIGYIIGDQETGSTSAATAAPVDGFAYDNESTAMHTAGPGVTTDYMGNSGVLYPDPLIVAPVIGFETANQASPLHLSTGLVTGEYFGYSGELYPALAVPAAAAGFDYDHETSSIHLNTGSVTGEYFGDSGSCSPRNRSIRTEVRGGRRPQSSCETGGNGYGPKRHTSESTLR